MYTYKIAIYIVIIYIINTLHQAELVNRPSLIFLSDPLAGLQWHEAEAVAACLQR